MMKHKQLNLILGVLAMLMLGGVLLTQKKAADTASASKPLTSLAPDAVDKIAIKHPDKPEVDLEKKNGTWSLTAPVAIAADPFEVKSLTDLASAKVSSTIDDLAAVKLKDFGLDPPAYQISLNGQTLEFGGTEPLRYQRYVKTDGHIALIDDPQGTALDGSYAGLVSKRLLPEGAEIAKIEVPGLVVTRATTGPGWTSSPADTAASSDRLQKFADGWREARSIWNQGVSKMGTPAKNPETATVTLKDGSTLAFQIAARDPQLVLERSDLQLRYNLPKTAIDQLLKLPALPGADKAADAAGATPVDKSGTQPAP
jgi:hypothetical protein